jgi:hypothetical protein
MPKGQSEKIKLFIKFLDKDKIDNLDKLITIEDILNLPFSSFNFFTDADINLIEQYFQIKSIGQLSSLDPVQPFKDLYKDQILRNEIEQLLLVDLEIFHIK